MQRSNKDVYPISFAFEQFLIDQKIDINDATEDYERMAQKLHEMLGEYEHGTADVEDLFTLMEKQLTPARNSEDIDRNRDQMLGTLSGIYQDILLTMKHS